MGKYRLAIFSSSVKAANFPSSIIEATKTCKIPHSEAVVCISNKSDGAIFSLAQKEGIAHFCINKARYTNVDQAILDCMKKYAVDIIILAGYLKKIGPRVVQAYPGRILNVHPGPLPQTGGKGMMGIVVQEAALAAGAKYTGPTVHIVDEEYDHGAILAHYPIKIEPSDTAQSLHEKCNFILKDFYVECIRDYINNQRNSRPM